MNTITVQLTDEQMAKWEESVQKFVREHPGRPVPSALLRWLFNMSSDEDLKVAAKRLEKT